MKLTRVLSAVLLVVSFAALPVFADDALVKHLQRTEERLLKAVDGLSEAQWNYKPAPDRWSIAEVVEHIAAAEPFIRGVIEKTIAEGPAAADSKKDETVLTVIMNREQKFKAPEPLVPTKRFATPAEALASFRTERAASIKVAGSDADFRAHAFQHPGFGMLDAHGWLLFLSGHSERHTLQIEEVKRDAAFPAK